MKNILCIAILLLAAWSATASPLVYRALLSQNATGNPTANVLENTLGGTPTLTRIYPGLYRVDLAGAFEDEENIFGFGRTVLDASFGTTLTFMRVTWDDETKGGGVWIYTFDVNMQTGIEHASDSRLNRTPFQLLVYP